MSSTTRITVTLPSDQVAELRKLTDNVSGYVAEAVARQIRHQLLGDDLRRHEEEHGPFSDEELTEARAKIFGSMRHRRGHGSRVSERIETVLLDSEGLSAWIAQDRKLLAMLQVFHDMGADLVIGANTIVEVTHSRTNMPRLNWTLSRIKVEPVTEQAAKAAAELLKGAGLHGHKYAIDATVAEVALRQPKPVALLTSDSDDMTKLCGNQVRIIPL